MRPGIRCVDELLSRRRGRAAEAVREFERALELEPLNINAGNNFAAIHGYGWQTELAIATAILSPDATESRTEILPATVGIPLYERRGIPKRNTVIVGLAETVTECAR